MSGRLKVGRLAPWWRRFKRNGYRPDRCDLCEGPFRGKARARHSYTGSDKHWHGYCQAYVLWRRKAEERLVVIDLMADLSGLTKRDVIATAEFRANDTDQRIAASNAAWRAFYDLELRRAATPDPAAATDTDAGGGE